MFRVEKPLTCVSDLRGQVLGHRSVIGVAARQVPGARSLRLADELLAGAWDSALHLAWEAFRAQTTPVGAVIVNGAGETIAAGRGRRYEATAPGGQLAGTHIAHAEVNALAQLPSERHWEQALLLTTLGPRGMCHGAAIQSTAAGFCFAGRDPYGGTAALRFGTPQSRRREFIIGGPLPGPRGALAEILHIAFLMNRGTAAHVVDAQRAVLPQLTEYTEHVSSVLQDAARRDDYLCATEIAAAAPRDAVEPRPGSTKLPQAEIGSRRGDAYADLASWITVAVAALGLVPDTSAYAAVDVSGQCGGDSRWMPDTRSSWTPQCRTCRAASAGMSCRKEYPMIGRRPAGAAA
jgi:tRNA(adenine34) deaminase